MLFVQSIDFLVLLHDLFVCFCILIICLALLLSLCYEVMFFMLKLASLLFDICFMVSTLSAVLYRSDVGIMFATLTCRICGLQFLCCIIYHLVML